MTTIEQAMATFGVTVDAHLDRQAEIPVLSGLQFQGDVAVVPVDGKPGGSPIPEAGVPVVRGQAEANTHLLVATGKAYFAPARRRDGIVLGLLTVAEGATAYLAHPEHAFAGIAPGTYELRRQREQADGSRLVAD
ncbi:hypothetical protein ACWEPC_17375 [Nonomuraea sp. NPDC004297]